MAKTIFASTVGPSLAIDQETGLPCEPDQPEPIQCPRCFNTTSDLDQHLATPGFTGHDQGSTDGSA